MSEPTIELPVEELSRATQHIEEAVERVESVMAATQAGTEPIRGEEKAAIVESVGEATQQIREAVRDIATLVEATEERPGSGTSAARRGIRGNRAN